MSLLLMVVLLHVYDQSSYRKVSKNTYDVRMILRLITSNYNIDWMVVFKTSQMSRISFSSHEFHEMCFSFQIFIQLG
jgi:hypothetical protein